MKILWILNGCGLEGKSVTGAPVRFHEISRRWQSFGFEQHLITTPGGLSMLRSMGSTLPATVLPASLFLRNEPFRFFRLWSYIVTTFAASFSPSLKRIARSLSQDDVILSVSDYFCDVLPAKHIASLSNAQWIAWIHHRETPPSLRPGNRLVNSVSYYLQERSFKTIAKYASRAWTYLTDAGDLVEQRLSFFGMPKTRIRRMACGINLHTIRKIPPPPRKTIDAVMIGIRPNKGLYDILPIWERVLALRPGSTLRLMGGMSGEEHVLEEIRRKNLDSFISVLRPEKGLLSPSQYYAAIKDAKILFAPSHEEGWGMAVCEAMASELPVVAYDLPVYRRIYGNALCTIPLLPEKLQNFDAFAKAVVLLLTDTQSYSSFVSTSISCASQYDWDSLATLDASALPTPHSLS